MQEFRIPLQPIDLQTVNGIRFCVTTSFQADLTDVEELLDFLEGIYFLCMAMAL